MIRVSRDSVPVPKTLLRTAPQEVDRLGAFFVAERRSRSQKTADFNADVWTAPEVRTALRKLFNGNCAYCETPLERAEQALVDHFRPLSHSTQLDGKVDPDHYWWLAYDWDNLYSVCAECNRAKGSRFPVRGRRAAPNARGKAQRRERAMLLDPCKEDPAESLIFLENGMVEGRNERGAVTVKVFNLNRSSLVEGRRAQSVEVKTAVEHLLQGRDPRQLKQEQYIETVMLGMEQPVRYRALIFQQARRTYQRAMGEALKAKSKVFRYRPSRAEHVESVWLDKVEIENFKALRRLEVQFPSFGSKDFESVIQEQKRSKDDTLSEPWIMLLGENGVGKSSLLKAIGLALMTDKQREKVVGRAWRNLLSRGGRARSGMIRLTFSTGADPVELHFSAKGVTRVLKGEPPKISLLGYGATRLLPPRSKSPRPLPARVRLENLFSPRVDLQDAERWIASPKAVEADEFNLLAQALKPLLSLQADDRILRKERLLFAKVFDQVVPVRELSDGYQSMLAVAADMMLNLSHASFSMKNVEGVVLIDELEAHLHPRWKIAIVSALRKMFPRVRFIATTHDPLCVQGLRPGELHVMARHPETREVRIEQVDVPPGMRADQILTGAWFGLTSTRDPETIGLMREHSKLLVTDKRTAEEQGRLDHLERVLQSRIKEYGGTTIELLGLQAAAEVARERPTASPVDLKTIILSRLREKTISNAGGLSAPLSGAAAAE
jgi:uncharacterized protein (TIGR02646 family)